MQKCFIEKLNSTKLIYHLGGFGFDKKMQELGVYSLVDGHPGIKGPMFCLSEDASSAATWYYGSALTKL